MPPIKSWLTSGRLRCLFSGRERTGHDLCLGTNCLALRGVGMPGRPAGRVQVPRRHRPVGGLQRRWRRGPVSRRERRRRHLCRGSPSRRSRRGRRRAAPSSAKTAGSSFLVDSPANSPRWPGNRLVLYNVAEKAGRSDWPIPESLYNPRSLSPKDGWEPALLDVYFESGPAVTMSTGMVKFTEHPPVVTDTRCIHWSPGQSRGSSRNRQARPAWTKEQRTDDKDSWVVVRPDGGNPFRTVWVNPDGAVVELLPQRPGIRGDLVLRHRVSVLLLVAVLLPDGRLPDPRPTGPTGHIAAEALRPT